MNHNFDQGLNVDASSLSYELVLLDYKINHEVKRGQLSWIRLFVEIQFFNVKDQHL